MSKKPSREVYLPYQLPSSSTVYRMIPVNADWVLPDGSLDPALFYRRSIDTDGVSVTTTLSAGMEKLKRRGVAGARSLEVGQVRAIEPTATLDVRSKGAENIHAAITGLPYADDDPISAERFAGELIKISQDEPLPADS